MTQTQSISFAGGFYDAPVAASHAFRAAMTAMARPGDIKVIEGAQPPKGLSVAAGSLLLTLCDPETAIFLASDVDSPELRGWLTFHTGAPFAPAEKADFAIGGWEALTPLDQFKIGTAEYPDRSATLVVEMPELSNAGPILSGPGIKETARLSLPSLTEFQGNAQLFPLGLDFFFTSGSQVAALPRSTSVMAED